jgi:hypothetical protein
MTAKKSAIRSKKQARNQKLRPKKEPDGRVKHAVNSLAELIRGPLDGRLKVAKKKKELEESLIYYCGGPQSLNPLLLGLIEEIAFKKLLLSHCQKMILLGYYEPSQKFYLPLSNSYRLDIRDLESMLREGKHKTAKSLEQYIDEVYGADSE